MALSSSDISFVRAATNNDTDANGGRMGSTAVASASKNNVFPDVTQAQRTSGLTRWRKLFVKAANAAGDALTAALVHLSKTANGDDYITMAAGDWRDTQADLSSPREYGVGVLAANVSAGASPLTVTLESSALDIFQDGDTIWIGEAGSVNGEYHENVTASKSGSTVTITLASGDTLGAAYSSGVYVASCLPLGTIAPAAGIGISSAAGTFDEPTYPIEVSALGATEDTFTLTFTSATAFTCSGLYAGALPAGTTGADYAPNNSATGLPYFTLRAAGWGGTFETGDTAGIDTHPSAKPIWLKQVVPAGAAATASDTFELAVKGESA